MLNEIVFLPSLHKLQIDQFDVYDEYQYDWRSSESGVVQCTSNVEEVVIGRCGPDLDNLINLVQLMDKLKRLDFASTLGPYGNDRYGRMKEIKDRAQFELDVMSLVAARDFAWKMGIESQNESGFLYCTVRLRALECADELAELEETRNESKTSKTSNQITNSSSARPVADIAMDCK